MSQISWGKHALILAALFVNLWVGGDLVEIWLGRGARGVFEGTLILGYLMLIIGMRAPMPWHYWRERRKTHEPAPPAARADDRDHQPWRSL